MDLLHITNRVQMHEFYKKVKQEILSFKSLTVFKVGDLLGGWKFARNVKFLHSISKLYLKTQDHGVSIPL